MEMRIELNVDGKQTFVAPFAYGNVDLDTIDVVSDSLEKVALKVLRKDLHKDIKPTLKELVGKIVLPPTKGDMTMVLSYKTLQTGRDTDKDWSITWPKADKNTVCRVQKALLLGLVDVVDMQLDGKI